MDYQEQEDGLLDKAEHIATAALALGAGAAFLYRAGGNKFLSTGISRTSYALREARESLSGQTLRDINGKGKEVLTTFKNTFKESYKNFESEGVRLRLDSSESLLSSIQEANNIIKHSNSYIREAFTQQKFIPGLKQDIADNIYQMKYSRINTTIDALMNHMSDYLTDFSELNGGEKTNDYRPSTEFINEFLSDLTAEQQKEFGDIVNKNFTQKEEKFREYLTEGNNLFGQITDELLNVESLAKKYGTKGKETNTQKFFDELLSDQRATVRDLLEHKEQIKETTFLGDNDFVLEKLEELAQKDERFLDLYVDPSLRIKKDVLYSYAEVANIEQNLEEQFLYTTPGKLLKPLNSRVQRRNAPNIIFSPRLSVDYLIPKLLEDRESTILRDSYVRVNNKGFSIEPGGYLLRQEKLDNLIPVSGRYGIDVRLLKYISGDVDQLNISRGFIKELLDIGSSPKINPITRKLLNAEKIINKDWEANAIQNLLDNPNTIKEMTEEDSYILLKKLNNFFKRNTDTINKNSALKMERFATDDEVKDIFHMLSLNDEELLETLASYNTGKNYDRVKNRDLISLIKKYKKNPQKSRHMVSIFSKETTSYGFNREYSHAEYLPKSMRKELSKEALLRIQDQQGDKAMFDFIRNANLSAKEERKMNKLASYAILQHHTELFYSDVTPRNLNHKEYMKKQMDLIFNNNTEESRKFRNIISEMTREGLGLLDDADAPLSWLQSIQKANRPNDYIYMQKAINPLDIIRAENKEQKAKAFFKQFTAGRKNMEDFTTLSIYPYFALHRLMDSVPYFNFSAKNTGSVIDLGKNILTRRVLPVALGISTYKYLDFESKQWTGKGITEAFFNSAAKFDLGVRTVRDKFGNVEDKKNEYYTNPAYRYFHNSPYQTAQEKAEWYKTGKKPVRKGRWWMLSNSEFRGTNIEYFEPSALKQASTPWQDIALYGDSKNKWRHSWFPTLRYPLSPIVNLLDPYYLERKHYYDMPYPITAPLFNEGAPWSSIGNATIGNLIKPQHRMHNNVLGGNLIDVRDLIKEQNLRIKQKAINQITIRENNDISIKDSNNQELNDNTKVLSSRTVNKSNISKEIISNNLVSLSQYTTDNNYKLTASNKLNLLDKIILRTNTKKSLPIIQIEQINQGIKQKAINNTGLAKAYQNTLTDDVVDMLSDKSILSQINHNTTSKQYVNDLFYSAKELGGIYGFLFEEMMPNRKTYRLENANDLTSYSRRFWDKSIGGTGGEVMEIARRFFPHKNRNIIDVNPIRNTMPSWIPEMFHHGNPYTKVKKGEMRLPGKAYEAINHYTPNIDFSIHPRMIGASTNELVNYFIHKKEMDEQFNSLENNTINVSQRDINKTEKNIQKAKKKINKLIDKGIINPGEFYSDFERFKILADVAPWSQEYKDYKKKVQNNLTSYQQKEYEDILERVKQQSSKHDFSNYIYKNVHLKTIEGYIDKVIGDNFTLVGSTKIYSMAGITADKKAVQQVLSTAHKVRLKINEDDEKDNIIKAIVYSGTTNLNREMINKKIAKRNVESTIDARALATNKQAFRGALFERIGHLPIPYLHNRFFKLETARESYENDQVYGTNYATWSHPIKGYIQPAFNKSMNVSPLHAVLGVTAFASNFYLNELSRKANPEIKKVAQLANIAFTPGAITGAVIGYGTKLSHQHEKKGIYAASAIFAGGYLVTNAQNPIIAIGAGTTMGKMLGSFMERENSNKYAAYGAIAGLGLNYLRNPDMSLKGMTKKWIPKNTKKKWEINEYFDRLEYLKYNALYERAAYKAKQKEGINIKGILNKIEKEELENQKERNKIKRYQFDLNNSYFKNTKLGQTLSFKMKNTMNQNTQIIINNAGKYTRSALAYKQARDSTIYGLKDNATWSQILRALPKDDRDYFLEFAKVKNKKEQDKILKVISPYEQNILKKLWGRKTEKLMSNEDYFKSHKLPSIRWKGWRPEVDLENVKAKTIQNEGMLLSDFGIYDSQKDDSGYKTAPVIRNIRENTNILELRKNLFSTLTGVGLTGVEVSIQESDRHGIQVISDFVRISDYSIKQKINSVFGQTYY